MRAANYGGAFDREGGGLVVSGSGKRVQKLMGL